MYTCFIFSGSKIEACRCGFSLENQVGLDIRSYQIIRLNSTSTSVSKICVHRNICINNIRESQRLRFASVARVRGPPSKARIRVVFMRYGHRAGGAASPGHPSGTRRFGRPANRNEAGSSFRIIRGRWPALHRVRCGAREPKLSGLGGRPGPCQADGSGGDQPLGPSASTFPYGKS